MARLDINGRLLVLTAADSELLRDAAAAGAASSIALRDLSLLLVQAIERDSVVALQRAEARALAELLRTELLTNERLSELRDALKTMLK